MTQLPRALARWRNQLELFPEDVATLLGGLVQRLAPAFEALVASEQMPNGDVDGFDGIGQRGSYERLLPTEWMLRQAAPLEFLRRAVSAEQAFFQLAFRRPMAPDSTLVLLDAGPDQLGNCRLAQLALLVLLLERAESRGQPMHWQLLHLQAEGLRLGLNEQLVRGFLHGRTASRSGAATLEAWADAAQQRRVWLIGPPAITALGRQAFARITLRERAVSSAPVLDVKLESASRARSVVLPLPEPAVAAKVLRDPFEQARAPKVAVERIASHLLLSPKGSRLFHRNTRGQLVAIPIPNSPRATVGSSRQYPVSEGALISSVGGRGRKLVWLAHAQGEVSVHFADDRRRPKDAKLVAEGPLPDRDALGHLAWFPGERMAVYVAHDHSLWRTDFRAQRSRRVAEGVSAWLQLRERYFVAVDRWLEGDPSQCVLELKPYKDRQAFLASPVWDSARITAPDQTGASMTVGYERNGVWELQEQLRRSEQWMVKGTVTLHAPPNTIVLGVEAFTTKQRHPGLWLLEADRRSISIVRLCSTQHVLTSATPIAHACLACAAPVLAATTAGGALSVLDDEGRALYLGTAGE